MNFHELQKLTQLLKQLRALRNLTDQLQAIKELKEFGPQFAAMDESTLESLREQTDYDRDEWMALINQIKKGS